MHFDTTFKLSMPYFLVSLSLTFSSNEIRYYFKLVRGHSNNSDTLGGPGGRGRGGGGSTKCHMNLFCFLNSDLKALRSKNSSFREKD